MRHYVREAIQKCAPPRVPLGTTMVVDGETSAMIGLVLGKEEACAMGVVSFQDIAYIKPAHAVVGSIWFLRPTDTNVAALAESLRHPSFTSYDICTPFPPARLFAATALANSFVCRLDRIAPRGCPGYSRRGRHPKSGALSGGVLLGPVRTRCRLLDARH